LLPSYSVVVDVDGAVDIDDAEGEDGQIFSILLVISLSSIKSLFLLESCCFIADDECCSIFLFFIGMSVTCDCCSTFMDCCWSAI